jgi:hypothetical protein
MGVVVMTDKKQKDFTTQWIFAYYEDGMAVSKIAHAVKLTEQQVYVRMRQHPETYEDIKKVREKMYRTRIRRIRGLSDTITEGYLDRISDKIIACHSDEELDTLYEQIDINTVQKIGKTSSDRVQVAEGKATSIVGTPDGLPFQVLVTRLPEGKTPDDFTDEELEELPTEER